MSSSLSPSYAPSSPPKRKIDEITPDVCNELRDRFRKEAAKMGLQLVECHFKYGRKELRSNRLVVRTPEVDDDGATLSVEKSNWINNLAKLGNRGGLTVDDYHRTFTFENSDYRLVGINPRSRVRPIIAKRCGNNGKNYLFTVKSVTTGVHIGSS